MNKQDKFLKYIKQEMDSVDYDGVDRMWDEFKVNSLTPSFIQQYFGWLIAPLIIIVAGLGIYLYSNSGEVGSQSANEILIGLREPQSVTKSEQQNLRRYDKVEYDDDINSRLSQSQTVTESDNSNKSNQNTQSTQYIDPKFSLAAHPEQRSNTITPIEQSTSKLTKSNTTRLNAATINQSIEDESISNQYNSSTSSPSAIKNIPTELAGSTTSLTEKSNNPAIIKNPIDVLKLIDVGKYLLNADILEPTMTLETTGETDMKRPIKISSHFGSAISETGLRVGTAGINYSHILGDRFNLLLAVGGQYEVGNIVSQDSIITTIGPSIIETQKDKDLNDLVSIYLSAIPMLEVGQFGIGIGPRLSYGVYNRYRIVESVTGYNSPDFNSYIFPSPDESFDSQDWSSLNRLRIGGDLVLKYQPASRLGLELHLTKNFNSLIKDNLANRDRSNSPLMLGLQLNYLIKY